LGLLQQVIDPALRHLEDQSRLFALEILHRDEQEGLPRLQRQGCQGPRCRPANLLRLRVRVLHPGGEGAQKALVETDPSR
jgi:hypothetical protein